MNFVANFVAMLVIILVILSPVGYLLYQAVRLARFKRCAREWMKQ